VLIPIFTYYYFSQRKEVIEQIESQVAERRDALDNFIEQTELYVGQLHDHMVFQIKHYPDEAQSQALPVMPNQYNGYFAIDHLDFSKGYDRPEIANIFGTGSVETYLQPNRLAEFKAVQGLFPLFRSGHRNMPQLAWSYYQSQQPFAAIYPWTTTTEIMEKESYQDLDTLMQQVFTMPFYSLGLPENNLRGEAYWTPIYRDPAGKGAMITHARPVQIGDQFYGIVATDLTLDYLGQYVRVLRSEQERMTLLDQQGQVVVARGDVKAFVGKDWTAIINRKTTIQTYRQNGEMLVIAQLQHAPFQLVYAIPKQLLSPFYTREFLSFTVAITLFLMLTFASYMLLKHRMIDPALALTDHIRNEAAQGKSSLEHVPEVWRPWFREVSDTLALKAVSANLPGAILQFRRNPKGIVQNIFISDSAFDIIGVTSTELKKDVRVWNNLVDRDTNREIGRVLNHAAKHAEPVIHEYKITTPQGEEKWLRFSANPRRDTDDFCMFEGLLLDITQVKKAELALRDSAQRMRSILEMAPFALVITNLESGEVIYINRKGAELFGLQQEDLIGQQGHASWQSKDERRDIFQRIARGETIEDREVKLTRRGGDTFWATLSATSFEYMGESCILFTYNDITNRKELENDLKVLATTDSLTGALNRRAFMERGNFELARNKRYGGKLGVLLLDVDFFKRINDTYGHAAGDETLRHLVNTLQNTLRETDIIGRLGGEEFAAILPQTTSNEALSTAQRLCRAVRETDIQHGNQTFRITISIGVTEQFESDQKLDQLLARADKATYDAKDAGRDQVVFFSPSETQFQEIKNL
jgi:diguanylate cyclase (GGDEF)-like protein/PAS domain S-box-containing protein